MVAKRIQRRKIMRQYGTFLPPLISKRKQTARKVFPTILLKDKQPKLDLYACSSSP